MKQKVKMNVETSLRNIESSMRVEGFEFSEETRAACREVLEGAEQAGVATKKVMDCLVIARLPDKLRD